ncbi:MAG: hypothetical protein HY077_06630 [Elusimicrobia bacterium]|nr:hypothetical protein [Elusimicrobiota bacterium]
MGLTPAEKDLLRMKNSRHLFEPGWDGLRDYFAAYDPLRNKVEAEREAAGLLPWPDPPIQKPARFGNAMNLLIMRAEDPAFLSLPIIDQDAWFSAMCALDAVLALVRSPGFDALPGREQIAALFGRWPESQ